MIMELNFLCIQVLLQEWIKYLRMKMIYIMIDNGVKELIICKSLKMIFLKYIFIWLIKKKQKNNKLLIIIKINLDV